MKLPSMQQITDEALRTLRRFPFVLFVAAVGTIAALILSEWEGDDAVLFAQRLLYTALFGAAFLIGLTLLAEKRRMRSGTALGLQAAGVLLLGIYAWLLPEDVFSAPQVHAIRLLMLAAGMHLFVAFAPFTGRGEINGFWHYNKTLFLRLLTAGLFTLVLYAGLAIALAAIENLFEVEIPGERYLQLWIVLVGMFNTWFFLAGVPEDLDALDAEEEYPKGIKIFAQYVVVPLVVIYLVILVAYTGKILIAWNWPYGWVSRLILGFSAAGMFAMLLLYPIREREGNRWILSASRWFFIVLAPLLVMYFLAVMERLSDYGMTESRYLAIVIGVWLAAMVLYFLFSRGRSIKILPISLCVLAFLVSAGPWSAFSVSEQSQAARLRALFEKNEMFTGDTLRKAPGAVTYADAREVSAVLQYLHDVHGYDAISSWFPNSLYAEADGSADEWKSPSDVADMVGLDFVHVRSSSPGGALTFDASDSDAMRITGYDRALAEHYFHSRIADRLVEAGDVTYSMNAGLDTLIFIDGAHGGDTLRLAFDALRDALITRYHEEGAGDVPLERLSLEDSSATMRVKIYLPWIQLREEEGGYEFESIRLRVLYGRIEHLTFDD